MAGRDTSDAMCDAVLTPTRPPRPQSAPVVTYNSLGVAAPAGGGNNCVAATTASGEVPFEHVTCRSLAYVARDGFVCVARMVCVPFFC